MLRVVDDRLWLVQSLRAEQIRQAADARLFARPRAPIRRAIGASIVRFGTRLAGEPPYTPARSR